MKTDLSLVELAQAVTDQAERKRDFVAPTKQLRVANDGDHLTLGDQPAAAITDHAHRQLGDWAKIPAAYYDRLRNEHPDLLAANLNRWLENSDDKRLVRCLSDEPGGAPAVVRSLHSDRYRTLDNEQLAAHVLPVLLNLPGVEIKSCSLTESKLYIKAINPNLTEVLKYIPGYYGGDGHDREDILQAGVIISNSEIGLGRLIVSPGIHTVRCTNLAVFKNDGFAKHHLGRSLGAESTDVFEFFSDETKAKTDEAIWLQLRDTLKASFDGDLFHKLVARLRDATEDVISKDAKVEDVVEVFTPDCTGTERESILQELIRGGDLSRYGLHSAVTRFSQEVESYDRASELERLGGKIIELPKSQWREVAKAA